MQLLQKLTEQADRQQEVVQLIDLIKQAKPFFDQRGDSPYSWLYRGVKKNEMPTGLVGVVSPRQDRQPLDTSPQIHQMLDDRLLKDFGYRYRSTSTFVTSDSSLATDFGSLCVVLPLGEFKYVYAEKVRDAYNMFRAQSLRVFIIQHPDMYEGVDTTELSALEGESRWLGREIMNWIDKHPALHAARDAWFEQQYAKCGFVSPDNIMKGIDSSNEIMLHCDSVALIPFRIQNHPDLIRTVEQVMNIQIDFNFRGRYLDTNELINTLLPHIFK